MQSSDAAARWYRPNGRRLWWACVPYPRRPQAMERELSIKLFHEAIAWNVHVVWCSCSSWCVYAYHCDKGADVVWRHGLVNKVETEKVTPGFCFQFSGIVNELFCTDFAYRTFIEDFMATSTCIVAALKLFERQMHNAGWLHPITAITTSAGQWLAPTNERPQNFFQTAANHLQIKKVDHYVFGDVWD